MDYSQYSPLNLAYLGDAVFELYVRKHVLKDANEQVNKLHKKSRAFVNAGAQSQMYFKVLPLLTEEETAVLKRGRNAKSATKAKNATLVDYKHATGLEALFGYLYLEERFDRLYELMEICISAEPIGIMEQQEGEKTND